MRFCNADGRSAVLVGDQLFDLAQASSGALSSDPTLLVTTQWEQAVAFAAAGALGGGRPLAGAALGPPVPRPGTIFGIGLNYRDHAAEAGLEAPQFPTVFAKFPASVCGPHDDVVLPAGVATADWEAEVAVVIGREARDVPVEDGWDHVAGLMAAQDVSDRELQLRPGVQFSLGKSRDTFCPLGPVLVAPTALDDPDAVAIRCRLNGELVQDSCTDQLIFGVPRLVALLSSVLTLRPGDVILTGTPSGVGIARTPPRHLADGDVLETEVAGVGLLRNVCRAASR